MTKGILAAAEELHSPVIIGPAESLLPGASLAEYADMMLGMARRAGVPVALHFDHGFTPELVEEAIRLGFSSVMYDCSMLLAGACSTPLVLHGGSGLSDDDFRACVAGGISKINIFTHNNLTAARAAHTHFTESVGAFELMPFITEAVKHETMHHMRVFGSDGKA